MLGDVAEAEGDYEAAAAVFHSTLQTVRTITGVHPLVGKLSCCLGRALFKLQPALKDRGATAEELEAVHASALAALAHSFDFYDCVFGGQIIDLLVPALVMGQAEPLGRAIGQMVLQIQSTNATLQQRVDTAAKTERQKQLKAAEHELTGHMQVMSRLNCYNSLFDASTAPVDWCLASIASDRFLERSQKCVRILEVCRSLHATGFV